MQAVLVWLLDDWYFPQGHALQVAAPEVVLQLSYDVPLPHFWQALQLVGVVPEDQ